MPSRNAFNSAEEYYSTLFHDSIWHAEGGNGNGPDFARLAKESRNNVRDCLGRLEVELMAL